MKTYEKLEVVGAAVMLTASIAVESTMIPFIIGLCIAAIGLIGEHNEKKKLDRARAEREHRRNMRIDFRVGE